jgi:MFS family permease
MVARYRSVLALPGSSRLILSALLGRLPQGMNSLAILLLVRQSSHSYAHAGVAVGAYTLMCAACAPVQGRLVDRFGRPRVLLPAAFLQAAALVALVLAASAHLAAVGLIVLSGLAGALMPAVAPTVRALLREVFPDPVVRESAYALDAVVQEVIWTTGPLVIALVITAASPAAAVLLVAVVCVVGTLAFAHAPLALGGRVRLAHEPRPAALGDRDLRLLLMPIALTGLALGAVEIGLPALALHSGSRAASGLLLAVWSVGSMAGGLLYGARSWSSSLPRRYRALLGASILFTVPLLFARSIPAGLAASFVAGMTIAPVFSCQYALIGELVQDGAETEAFTWFSGALVTGIAVGNALGGAIIPSGGVSAPFALACLAGVLAAGFALLVGRGASRLEAARPAAGTPAEQPVA